MINLSKPKNQITILPEKSKSGRLSHPTNSNLLPNEKQTFLPPDPRTTPTRSVTPLKGQSLNFLNSEKTTISLTTDFIRLQTKQSSKKQNLRKSASALKVTSKLSDFSKIILDQSLIFSQRRKSALY